MDNGTQGQNGMESTKQSSDLLMDGDEAEVEIADELEMDGEALCPDWDVQSVQIQTQVLDKRERLITATVLIAPPFTLAQVWDVLTHYEALAEFIPNLAKSHCLPHPTGGIRLEQVGMQRLLKLNFKARVVLDLVEHPLSRIDFTLVEGDFQRFVGHWQLSPQTEGILLSYQVQVIPKRTLPIKFIESRICKDLPINLLAIRDRVYTLNLV